MLAGLDASLSGFIKPQIADHSLLKIVVDVGAGVCASLSRFFVI